MDELQQIELSNKLVSQFFSPGVHFRYLDIEFIVESVNTGLATYAPLQHATYSFITAGYKDNEGRYQTNSFTYRQIPLIVKLNGWGEIDTE